MRIAIAVITGHCKLNKHMNRIGLSQNIMCENCQTDEDTAYHLVCLCPAFAQLRMKMLGKFILNLTEVRNSNLEDIINFVIKTGKK